MSASRRIHAVLDSYGKNPSPIRNGKFQACCPAHDDRSPSLSVGELPTGVVLIHCHAGCSTDSVMEAMNLRLGDLYPDGPKGEWGPLWWASNRKEREAKETTAREDAVILEICHAMRKRGEKLSTADKEREALAFRRLNT